MGSLPHDPDVFRETMKRHLAQWQEKHFAVWTKIPSHMVHLVPVACELGFKCHHANEKYFMMTRWFPVGNSKLPTFGTHNVGVSVLVIRQHEGRSQLLMVREKYAKKTWNWKCVSGGVELGEFIPDAAVRELREETGLRGRFVNIIGVWNRKNTKFGRGEIHFGCLVSLLPHQNTDKFELQEDEILDAKWIDLEEALNNAADDPRGIERYWIVSLLSSIPPDAPEPSRGLTMIETSDFRGPSHRMHFHLTGWDEDLFKRAGETGVLEKTPPDQRE